MSPPPAVPTFTSKARSVFGVACTSVLGRPPAEADLQRHFGVSPPSVHQMVLTPERAGLIRRQPGGRSQMAYAPAGIAAFARSRFPPASRSSAYSASSTGWLRNPCATALRTARPRRRTAYYVDPPAHAVVLSIDEKSQIQALDRTQPGLPIKPGRCQTMTHDYKRPSLPAKAGSPPYLPLSACSTAASSGTACSATATSNSSASSMPSSARSRPAS